MNQYELLHPNGKPCGVFACGVCNVTAPASLVERCCKPCDCGKPSRNRFEAKCSDCANRDYSERMQRKLESAELVEWDGQSMIFSEDVSGSRDGWFDSPDGLRDYVADDEDCDKPEFAFLGKKCVKKLDINHAIEQMTADTYEDAELHIADNDWKALLAAVDAFNEKYALTYYEHDYTRKVRIDD